MHIADSTAHHTPSLIKEVQEIQLFNGSEPTVLGKARNPAYAFPLFFFPITKHLRDLDMLISTCVCIIRKASTAGARLEQLQSVL